MLNTYNLFEKRFFYKELEITFVDFQVKEQLSAEHPIRGYVELVIKKGNTVTQDIFPVFLLDNELLIHIDLHDVFIPFSSFSFGGEIDELNIQIHSCFDANCNKKNTDLVVFNGGLVAACSTHLKNVCLENFSTEHVCSICGDKSDVFFSNHLGGNRTDLCEKHFLSHTDEEIYHSVYKHTF